MEINYKLQILHLEIFCSSVDNLAFFIIKKLIFIQNFQPISEAMKNRKEVEIVDLVLKIREKLVN